MIAGALFSSDTAKVTKASNLGVFNNMWVVCFAVSFIAALETIQFTLKISIL